MLKLTALTWKSLRNRRLTVGLTMFSITLSVALLLGVERLRHDARSGFANTISGTDLIVGARSGAVPLLLSTVFRIGNVSATATLAHVTLWTDLGIPTLDFDVYLAVAHLDRESAQHEDDVVVDDLQVGDLALAHVLGLFFVDQTVLERLGANRLGVGLVVAVGKVETSHAHPALDELAEHLRGAAGRPDVQFSVCHCRVLGRADTRRNRSPPPYRRGNTQLAGRSVRSSGRR